MDKALHHLKEQMLRGVRTARATTALVDNIASTTTAR